MTYTQMRNKFMTSRCVSQELKNIRSFLIDDSNRRNLMVEESIARSAGCPFHCRTCRMWRGAEYCQDRCAVCRVHFSLPVEICQFGCGYCAENLRCSSQCVICRLTKAETHMKEITYKPIWCYGQFVERDTVSVLIRSRIRARKIMDWMHNPTNCWFYDIYEANVEGFLLQPRSLHHSSILAVLGMDSHYFIQRLGSYRSLLEYYQQSFKMDLGFICAPFLQHLHLSPVYVRNSSDLYAAICFLDNKLSAWTRSQDVVTPFQFLQEVIVILVNLVRILNPVVWDYAGVYTERLFVGADDYRAPILRAFLLDPKCMQIHINRLGISDTFVPFFYFWNKAMGDKHRFYYRGVLDQLAPFDIESAMEAFAKYRLLFDIETNPGPWFNIGHTINMDQSVVSSMEQILDKMKEFLVQSCDYTVHSAKEAVSATADVIKQHVNTMAEDALKIVARIVRAACCLLLFMSGTPMQKALTAVVIATDLYDSYQEQTSSVAPLEVVEYQAGEDNIESTLGFLMKSLFHYNDMGFIRRHANDFRSITFAQNTVNSFKNSVVDAIMLVIKVFKIFYHLFTGMPYDITPTQKQMLSYIAQIQKEMSDLMALADENFMQVGTFGYTLEVIKLAKQVRSIIFAKVKEYSVAGTTFLATLALLERRVAVISSAMSQEPNRRQPVSIILSGGTAVGKTTLVPIIANAVALKLDMKYVTPSTVCYQHNNNQNDFFDGYRNQPFYWADEWLSTDDAETNYAEVTRWFKIANISPYPLNMADLESKGNTYFTSDFFIATTNRQRWNNAYLGKRESSEAFFRRIDICVEVKLDKIKIPESGEINPDAWSFEVFEYDGKTLAKTSQVINLDTLVAKICACYHHYGLNKRRMNEFIATLWQQEGRAAEVEMETDLRRQMQQQGPASLSDELTLIARHLAQESTPVTYQAGDPSETPILEDAEGPRAVTEYRVEYDNFIQEVNIMPYRRICEMARKIKFGIWSFQIPSWTESLIKAIRSAWEFINNKWTLFAVGALASIVALYTIFRKTEKGVELHSGETEHTQRRIVLSNHVEAQGTIDESNLTWIEKFSATNIVLLRALNQTGTTWSEYGVFVDDKTLVTNYHFISGSERAIRMLFADGSYSSFDCDNVTIRTCHERDLAIISFKGAMQGVRKITSKLLRNIDLCVNFGTALVIRPADNHVPFNFEVKYVPPLKIADNIVGPGEVRHRLTYASSFDSEAGQCGLPYFVISKGALFIAGIHFGMARSLQKSLMTTIVKEDFLDVVEKQMLMIHGPSEFREEELPNEESVYISRKSNIRPSVLQEEARQWALEENIVIDRAPAIMRPTGGVDPMQVAVSKFDVPDVPDAGDFAPFLTRAVDYLAEKHQMPKKATVELTWEEACYGVDSDEREKYLLKHIDSINMSTAAGYDYRAIHGKGKKKLLDAEGHFIPEVLTNALRVESNWEHGTCNSDVVAVDCLKDELRSSAKRSKCETRIISVLPVHYNIAVRKHTAPLTAWLMEHCTQWEMAVGINPHSLDWKCLYDRLRKHDFAIAGDYSGFDRTIPTSIGNLFVDYLVKTTHQPGKRELFKAIVNEMQHMPHIAGNCKYYPTHGNPSGQVLTACFNSFVNMTFCLATFLYAGRNESTPYNTTDYENHVAMTVFGDDHVMSVDRSCDLFNMLSIMQAAQQLGMKYTDNKKNKDLEKFLQWDDVTYLKRRFIRKDDEVYAPLERSVIFDMLSWVRDSESITTEEALQARAYNAVMENFHYGKEAMDQFRGRLNELLVSNDIAPISLSWEYVYRAFREGTIEYDTSDSFVKIWIPSEFVTHIPEHQIDPVWYNFRDEPINQEERVICSFGPPESVTHFPTGEGWNEPLRDFWDFS
ncbi:hypothetical protein 1 [Xinzhou nematode virus 2]|uniref:hypothetical protein 1 n=1 Tax=Xinzhou nematode virus 2 TaxID=1923770 RepID=UPI00090B6290|nr:hypothetical protein 1 [Xinzhou nematode virus 2]APG78595.1 hypothetical protein 1 [Xinzhou nematode virus 2]